MSALPEELTQSFKSGRGGIFVGAGLSVESGLPTWPKMLEELIGEAKKLPYFDKDLIGDCAASVSDPRKYLMIASTLREAMGSAFDKYIERRFGDETVQPNDYHQALHALPWQFILTTNYDRLIERSYSILHRGEKTVDPISYDEPGKAASSLFRQRPFVLKVHGDATMDPAAIILSESDYRNVIHLQAGLKSVLQTLFTTHSILFVGASLDDPDLMLLLGYVHSAFHGKTPPHFAIVSQEERSRIDAHHYKKHFSIHLLTYERTKRKETILSLLGELAAKAR